MQDIMDKLQNILSSKEGQDQLKNIASMLNSNSSSSSNNNNNNSNVDNQNGNNFSANQQSNQQSGFDMSAIASMLSGMQGGNSTSGNPLADTLNSFTNNGGNNNNGNMDSSTNSDSGFPNIDINMIMKLQQAFSAMNVNDKNTQLLLALKPHFSTERSKKVDQALGLMRMMTALPALKDSGILSGLFSL